MAPAIWRFTWQTLLWAPALLLGWPRPGKKTSWHLSIFNRLLRTWASKKNGLKNMVECPTMFIRMVGMYIVMKTPRSLLPRTTWEVDEEYETGVGKEICTQNQTNMTNVDKGHNKDEFEVATLTLMVVLCVSSCIEDCLKIKQIRKANICLRLN